MTKLYSIIVFLLWACVTTAQTPPQIINKTCAPNTFFSKIQPGPNNIQCTQPNYSGLLGTPSYIDSLQLVAGNVLLMGDSPSPGNTVYYGTDGTGTRGFYNFSGVSVVWGHINGTLSNQTDLQSALNAKQNNLSFGNLTDTGTDGITVTNGSGAIIGSGTSLAQHVADVSHNGYLLSTDWGTFNAKQASGNYLTALTGDGTAAGPGSSALTLATVNSNVGSFGDASHSPSITVNAKGLLTAASSNSIQIGESQVTGLVSDLAGKQAVGNYLTALTSDVVATGPGAAAATIQPNVVSNSKLAQMAAHTVKANTTGSTANASDSSLGAVTESTSSVLTLTGWTDATIGSPTIQVKQSSASVSGYLSSTDWSTFNNKAPSFSTGNLTDVGTDGITIGSGSGAVIGSGTTISQHVSDTTHAGYLSSTDWNTFNGKQASGSYLTALTGDITASGPGSAAATLATVNANVGTFAVETVNGKGLVTAASNLSGDATTSGAALTLATVNSNVGAFGSSTSIPSLTVNGKGLVTAASGNAVIAPAGTLSGATLNSTVTDSSLTSVGTLTSLAVTGSATAASFIPSGSTVPSNGMYLPAANTVGFATNTTARMQLNSTGIIGLGSAGSDFLIKRNIDDGTLTLASHTDATRGGKVILYGQSVVTKGNNLELYGGSPTAASVLGLSISSSGGLPYLATTGKIAFTTAGKNLEIAEGSNAKMGTATLNGTTGVVVATTAAVSQSRIFLTINAAAGTVGSPYVDTRSNGVSFTIKSTNASDTSSVAWIIFDPA